MSNLQNWVTKVTNDASWRAIAERMETTHVTIQRRLRNDTASAVIDLAREYNANPIAGLLAGDCITGDDIQDYVRAVGLDEYSDLELAQEIVDRLEQQENGELASVYEFNAVADSSPDEDALREQQEGGEFD